MWIHYGHGNQILGWVAALQAAFLWFKEEPGAWTKPPGASSFLPKRAVLTY